MRRYEDWIDRVLVDRTLKCSNRAKTVMLLLDNQMTCAELVREFRSRASLVTSATLSSLLKRMTDEGVLRRQRAGPRGGYVYSINERKKAK